MRTDGIETDNDGEKTLNTPAEALADMKFTYVVSCQVYGFQKKSTDARDYNRYRNVLNLMLRWALWICYVAIKFLLW